MWRLLAICALAAGAAAAQTKAANASISGVVKDAVSGQPLADYSVSTYTNAKWGDNQSIRRSASTREVQSTTDAQGRYRLSDLPSGEYSVTARQLRSFRQRTTRRITLAGKDLDGLDFKVKVVGVITGKVTDENNEPVPGMTIFLVGREYHLGAPGYFFQGITTTDDRGQYTLSDVISGNPYFVLAEKRTRNQPARSEVPLNPKLRRRIHLRTWYPNSPVKEGAMAITLSSGERREGVDIEAKKSQSYCISGTLEGVNGPAPLRFEVEPLQPSSGVSNYGGVFMASPGGTAGADGRFRVCDLTPGSYRLTANDMSSNRGQPNFGVMEVTISDRDISGLKIIAFPGLPLEGEVVLDGRPPEKPISTKITVTLGPLLRAQFMGETLSVTSEIPGSFSFPGLLIDDYVARARLDAPGLYIKDITYGGKSVRHEPLRMGSAMRGSELKVIVGQDGATLSARVTDKDGVPVADANVLTMPGTITSEGMLAATLVSGQTDQLGQYSSSVLAPGKYYVAASREAFDLTPESIGKLWRAHLRFQEVELPPGKSAQVSLEPVSIE